MSGKELNILLIEDSETDALLVRRTMTKGMKMSCNIFHVKTMKEAEDLLKSKKENIDIILLDLGLPDTEGGKDSFERLSGVKEEIPVIIHTSTKDHDLAVSIVGDGAEDYVRKSDFADDPKILCEAIEFAVHRHHHLQEIKEEKDEEIKEKERIIKWVTGSYSVMD